MTKNSKTHPTSPNQNTSETPQPQTSHKKTSHNIFIAFLLNLGFSIYEFIGGSLTGSTAIMSDAIHDLGDAISIGLSFLLEKKSAHRPDKNYTYGYLRYSLIGGVITTLVLLLGSGFVITNAMVHLFNPIPIDYDGMIFLAIIGAVINFIAAYFTSRGESLNQKSVNLHMLEDVLGWVVVLIGAIVMKLIDFAPIDPILSIGVAIFIALSALKNLFAILDIFLEKAPHGLSTTELTRQLEKLPGIKSIHHLHIWSIDESHHFATLHVVTTKPSPELKTSIRQALSEHHISHVTIEFESPNEHCDNHECHPEPLVAPRHHHHH